MQPVLIGKNTQDKHLGRWCKAGWSTASLAPCTTGSRTLQVLADAVGAAARAALLPPCSGVACTIAAAVQQLVASGACLRCLPQKQLW